jgi:hypothetical protein
MLAGWMRSVRGIVFGGHKAGLEGGQRIAGRQTL